MCGHCESSISVIRISRAVILSICKLPLKKIRDRDTSRDLKRIRSWIYNQIKEFKDDSGDEIKAVLSPKLSEIIFLKKFDIQPLWEEDDFGILLQQPSPSWIVRVNMLMLMGYRVVLVNFNDVARFSRKDLKVVHSDFSRLLCPTDKGDDDASDSESDVQVADNNVKTLFNQPPSTDDELFKQPPPKKDCPICCLRMPILATGRKYKSCCGKVICSGCFHAAAIIGGFKEACPLCSTPIPPSKEDIVNRTKTLVELNNATAICNIGDYYSKGTNGYPQDHVKALELWNKAAELGYAPGYHSIGCAYHYGNGVKVDEKKAIHYWELAAMQGHADARHNLGSMEARAGNLDRAFKHYTIAVRYGSPKSLKNIKRMYNEGHATKQDYTALLRVYQELKMRLRVIGEMRPPHMMRRIISIID